jgi:hypothetical protein
LGLQQAFAEALLPRLHALRQAGEAEGREGVSVRPTACELLATPEALLSTSHLVELGLSRRAIDSVLRECPTVHLPGYGRPLMRVADYLAFVDANTYDGVSRVRPT